MNLTTLQTRLRERIGNPTTSDVPDATLTIRLNEAYETIWDRFRFHSNRGKNTSITTVASTNSYAMASTIDVVRSVRDNTNGVKLRKLMQREWEEINQGSTTGKPTGYYTDGTNLYLDPNPDGAYVIQIEHRKSYTALSAGGDSPSLPSSWHLGVVLLARYYHWEVTSNWQNAQVADLAYKNWLSDKTDEIDEETFADSSFNVQPETLEVSLNRLDFDHENA